MQRNIAALAAVASLLGLTSCVPDSGYAPAPVPGYRDRSREANQRGYNLGLRDARQGREANFMQYHSLYDSSTKSDFGRGYMTGYRSVRPR